MKRPVRVEALGQHRLRVEFADGLEGVIDLGAEVGRGVFAALADEAVFGRVHIGAHGQIAWSPEVEICADEVYREVAEAAAKGTTHA